MGVKISQLPDVSRPIDGHEFVATVQSGVTVKMPLSAITSDYLEPQELQYDVNDDVSFDVSLGSTAFLDLVADTDIYISNLENGREAQIVFRSVFGDHAVNILDVNNTLDIIGDITPLTNLPGGDFAIMAMIRRGNWVLVNVNTNFVGS
jgi:hypothetical protein